MKIALLGYGRMGQTIERLALDRGDQIVLKVDPQYSAITELPTCGADVAIDFSIPSVALDHITACFEAGIPVVSGTTGWLEDFDLAIERCNELGGGFIYGSNFSLGVNLFFELNKKLAELMQPFEHYKSSMIEVHHTRKLDAPSGTAISLADQIIDHGAKKSWTIEQSEENDSDKLFIEVEREGDVPGTHVVNYDSSVDQIQIKHTAHNRDGFALGAVIAAHWLAGKTGVYTMRDVLNL